MKTLTMEMRGGPFDGLTSLCPEVTPEAEAKLPVGMLFRFSSGVTYEVVEIAEDNVILEWVP